jgi:hypothetical protein
MQKSLRTPVDDMYYFTAAGKEAWRIDRFSALQPHPVQSTFTNFPPERYYSGPSVLPDCNGRDKNFHTRIRDGSVNGVNFAGKFSIVEIKCGTPCRFTFVADASNGQVVTLPQRGKEQYQLGLDYSTDSRLMRATYREADWVADQSKDTDTCISPDILWTGPDFKVMSERAFEIEKSDYCSISY